VTGLLRYYRLREKRIDATVSVIVGLIIWEMVDSLWINNALVMVGPRRTALALMDLISKGELGRHVYATFIEFILGYLVGVTIGIGIGVLMSLSPRAKQVVSPWVTIFYNAPVILLAPVFITALGVGIISKIAIVFIGAVFPVLFNTYTGMTTVDSRLVEAVRAFGGSSTQIFFKVKVPSAIPLIMTGLRLSVGRAIVGAIVSEFFGSRAGIGYMISEATEAFRTAQAFAGVVLLALAVYITFEILKFTEKKLAPWYEFKI
jgi:NitT/TauT family transport system permease protein